MAKSYNRFRVRKGFNGVCVLQQLVSYPSFVGHRVDSSVRVYEWHDVPYSKAPSEFEIGPYRPTLHEARSNEIVAVSQSDSDSPAKP